MVEELLKQLGLGEKEIAIYLAVLKQGKITPTDAGRLTRINRTTVYSVAKELAQKGLIVEDLGATPNVLVARPVEDLMGMVSRQEKLIQNQKRMAENAVAELRQIAQKDKYVIPKITFIQESDLEDYLYKRSPDWHASIMKYDQILWGFQDHSFAEHYEKWIDWQWRTGAPKNLRLKLFSNKSEIETKNKRKAYQRRQIKNWKSDTGFTASVWVHGDYLIMVYTRQRPHYLVEIHDALLAANMREFFRGVWKGIKTEP